MTWWDHPGLVWFYLVAAGAIVMPIIVLGVAVADAMIEAQGLPPCPLCAPPTPATPVK